MTTTVTTQQALPTYQNEQAWYGPEMTRRTDWTHTFTPQEVEEIDAAVAQAEATGKDILEIGIKDFSLPHLSKVLLKARKETLLGRGFQLLRGVPVERYTLRQSAIAYWGIGLYFGDPVSQNAKGHVLGHVANLGLNYDDPEVRGYQTSARLRYHTDFGDLVALLCLRTAKSGGLSSIVSSTTVWNELVRRRPDCARTLMNQFYYTRWGEISKGELPFWTIPIFSPYDGRMLSTYIPQGILKAQALPGVPELTDEQKEAMAELDKLTADPSLYFDMEFKPGDIQVLSNYSTYHSRTAYEDWPEIKNRRHLLRLWFASPDGPALPQVMYDRFGTLPNGRPDGIRVAGVSLVAPLDPQ